MIEMGKFKEKLYSFFYGRYGVDQLYYFLLGSALVVVIADFITQWLMPEGIAKIILGLSASTVMLVLFVWMVFRLMSRNRYKRRLENEKFLKLVGFLRRLVTLNTSSGSKSGNADDGFYIFRDCTKCRATLRLPRKTGRNKVKCPRCSHKFYVKAKNIK